MNTSWKDFVKESAAVVAPQPKSVPVKTVSVYTGKYGGKNNMFNMRHYKQKWLGEVIDGLNTGDMIGFKTPWHGFRAGSRNVRMLMQRLAAQGKKKTIRNFTPVFSPKVENDVDTHMNNISKYSGLGIDDVVDIDSDDQMYKLLTGLAKAESGNNALMGLDKTKILEAIKSSRKSL